MLTSLRRATGLNNQIDAQDLDLAEITSAALRTQEFVNEKGEPISYGLSEVGTTASLEALTAERVRQLAKRVAASPATLSAVGDVDTAGLRAALQALPAPTLVPASSPSFAPIKTGKPPFIVRDVPTQTAWVFISYPLGRVTAEDAPALRVLSAALSDIASARLTKRLLGGSLVEGVPSALSLSSQFVFRRDGSELLLSAQTSASRVDKVKNALLDEVSKLKKRAFNGSRVRGGAHLRARRLGLVAPVATRPRLSSRPNHGCRQRARWHMARASGAIDAAKDSGHARRLFGSYAVALVMPRS